MGETKRGAITFDGMAAQQGNRVLNLGRENALTAIGRGGFGQIARQADQKEIVDGIPGQTARRIYRPDRRGRQHDRHNDEGVAPVRRHRWFD
jgi:hypothetical protein